MKRVVNIKIEVDSEDTKQFPYQVRDALRHVIEGVMNNEDKGCYQTRSYWVDYEVKYPEKWFLVSACKTTGADFLVQATTSTEAREIAREKWNNYELSFDGRLPSIAFTASEADPESYPEAPRLN